MKKDIVRFKFHDSDFPFIFNGIVYNIINSYESRSKSKNLVSPLSTIYDTFYKYIDIGNPKSKEKMLLVDKAINKIEIETTGKSVNFDFVPYVKNGEIFAPTDFLILVYEMCCCVNTDKMVRNSTGRTFLSVIDEFCISFQKTYIYDMIRRTPHTIGIDDIFLTANTDINFETESYF